MPKLFDEYVGAICVVRTRQFHTFEWRQSVPPEYSRLEEPLNSVMEEYYLCQPVAHDSAGIDVFRWSWPAIKPNGPCGHMVRDDDWQCRGGTNDRVEASERVFLPWVSVGLIQSFTDSGRGFDVTVVSPGVVRFEFTHSCREHGNAKDVPIALILQKSGCPYCAEK